MKYLFLISLLIGILLTESVKASDDISFWITALCSSKVDSDTQRPDCIDHYTRCAEGMANTPHARKVHLSKERIAVLFTQHKDLRVDSCNLLK